jgi:hypothetical protein
MAFIGKSTAGNGDIVRADDPPAAGHRSGRSKVGAMDDTAEISRQLVELRIEHRDLDVAIMRMAADRKCDELQLRRMKKRKLKLKDMIAYLENKLIPDLDA